jgi:hypothetical protein
VANSVWFALGELMNERPEIRQVANSVKCARRHRSPDLVIEIGQVANFVPIVGGWRLRGERRLRR